MDKRPPLDKERAAAFVTIEEAAALLRVDPVESRA
jgi:hypothetical protein